MPVIVSKLSLMNDLVASIRAFQDSVDFFDTSAARSIGVNDTDLRCLVVLSDQGPLTAGEVAKSLGLTKGATTTALNRLEKTKLAQRSQNSNDGRSFLVELTLRGKKEMKDLWLPMRELGRKHLSGYSESDLRLLIQFFKRSRNLQERCVRLLRKK